MDIFNITTPPPTYWEHLTPQVTPSNPTRTLPISHTIQIEFEFVARQFFRCTHACGCRRAIPNTSRCNHSAAFGFYNDRCEWCLLHPTTLPSHVPAHPPSIKLQRQNAIRQRRFQQRMNKAVAEMNASRLQKSIMLS